MSCTNNFGTKIHNFCVHEQRNEEKKEIAEAIGVANSTITRELHRNSSKRGVYKWEIFQKQAEKRRKRTPGNRAIRKVVWFSVKHYLVEEQWSPEQISGYLAKKASKFHTRPYTHGLEKTTELWKLVHISETQT